MKLSDCFMELMAYTGCLLKDIPKKQPGYEDVMEQYRKLIAHSQEYVTHTFSTNEDWRKAFFAVCAWVDESLLCSDWSGKKQWLESPLQWLYFNTTNAGEEFFTNLAGLGKEDGYIREVYGYCLVMGFKGSFFKPEKGEELKEIRDSNLMLMKESSGMINSLFLFPDAYDVLKKKKKQRTFKSFLLILLLGAVPVVFFIILLLFYKGILDKIVLRYLH